MPCLQVWVIGSQIHTWPHSMRDKTGGKDFLFLPATVLSFAPFLFPFPKYSPDLPATPHLPTSTPLSSSQKNYHSKYSNLYYFLGAYPPPSRLPQWQCKCSTPSFPTTSFFTPTSAPQMSISSAPPYKKTSTTQTFPLIVSPETLEGIQIFRYILLRALLSLIHHPISLPPFPKN